MVIRILCVCAFVFASKRVLNHSTLYSTETQTYPGYDMRYNETESDLAKIKFGEYIWKQKLLDTLMDPQLTIYEKWHIYDRIYLPNQVYGPNVFSGGLVRDWGCED